jgi:hypothetical protein
MSFSFSSLIRLLVLLAVGSTMLAVGLSRMDPPKPERRTRQHASFTNINEYFLEVEDRVPRWLDSDSGRIDAHATEDGDVLEAASCSPWVDEKGRYQVIGRWSNRTQAGPLSTSQDFGLARYAFPSGEMLDQVSTEIVPVSPPCWYPGTRARVIFVAGDGMLYHYAFEPERDLKGLEAEPKRDLSPKMLTWRRPKPGSGGIFISDLTWPEDPRMAGRVVVALHEQATSSEGLKHFTRTRLWWLKLNVAGTEVIEAAPLLEQDGVASSEKSDLRSPTVGTLADGTLVLAYLSQSPREPGWKLRVARIELEGDHQVPKALESGSLILDTKCQPASPSFSSDGRWLYAITAPDAKNNRICRLPTSKLFKSGG